jgi:hypothetical protein
MGFLVLFATIAQDKPAADRQVPDKSSAAGSQAPEKKDATGTQAPKKMGTEQQDKKPARKKVGCCY